VPAKIAEQDWTDTALKRAMATWPRVAMVTVALGSYLLFVAAYFLKGIAWATRTDAKPISQPLSAVDLRDRLIAINSLDVPFRIEPGRTDKELVAIWRYADAKWIDHARAHGMRRLHRVVLELDQPRRKARATDFMRQHLTGPLAAAEQIWNGSLLRVSFYFSTSIKEFSVCK